MAPKPIREVNMGERPLPISGEIRVGPLHVRLEPSREGETLEQLKARREELVEALARLDAEIRKREG